MEGGWRQNYQRYKSYFLNVVNQYEKRDDLKAYLEILLSLATISILAIFAIKPTFTTIAQLIKEIEGKEQTLATMEQKIENISSAKNLYDREIGRIELLKTAVPETPTPDILARQMEGLSAKHQVVIESMGMEENVLSGPKDRPPQETISPLPEGSGGLSFTINTQGGFISLFDLLNDMEILRRPLKFDSLQIRNNETGEGTKSLFMILQARAPYFNQAAINTK